MNPYIFIVGCPRSGTTLLQRIVNAHPQVAVTPESHWISRLYEKPWALKENGMVEHKLIRELGLHPKFARMGIDRAELKRMEKSGRSMTYAQLVAALFDLYGEAQGKPMVGDKTPDYVRHISTLHGLWPEARFVHVIRDGRDIFISMCEWPKVHPKPGDFTTWTRDPVSTAAWWWAYNVRLGCEVGRTLGPRLYYELRYEDLVTSPREECERLCTFPGMEFDLGMLRFHQNINGHDPGLEQKWAGLPVTQGLRNWRSQLTSVELERFEAEAGDMLDTLNYPRAISCLQAQVLIHAAEIRHLLSEDP